MTLLGRNGMGKTTTIRAIMGILRPLERRDPFRRADASTAARRFGSRARGLGLVPEGRQIFPNLTVRENLMATAANRGGASTALAARRVSTVSRAAPAAGSAGGLLSGGEQQMLAIGRALMTNPRLLILDEATEGLAPLVRRTIWAASSG